MSERKYDDHPEWLFYFAYNLHMDSACFSKLNIDFIDEGLSVLNDYSLAFNVLKDEFFRFEKYGLANIVPNAGMKVEGVLYRINGRDLATLDQQAGVQDLKYYRKSVTVNSVRAEKIGAVTYVGWPDKTANHLIPSSNYLNRLAYAASQIPTSKKFQSWLYSHPKLS